MRRLLWTLAALVAAGVFLFALFAPAASERVDTSGWEAALAARTVPGAYHVHTTRSDGHGDKAAVAAAAARAGLKFVILTDHGDGTRPPDPPEYVNGVLMLDCVEISTDDGHYVALDMPRAPYPLAGAAAAVVEDVHRLGGFGIAAHPDSPKPALRWTDDTAAIDGIEWINADSEWRDEGRRRLAQAGIGYLFRPAPALATLLDRPSTLDRWDRLAARRRIVALAGVDAHGGVGRRVEDPNRTFFNTVGIPSYEASFREMSNRVVLEGPLSGDAAADAKSVFAAIRKGSVFSAIDALASPALLDLHATPSGTTVTLFARAALPRGGELVILQDGRELGRGAGELRREVQLGPGAYRIEGRIPGAPGDPAVPWLVSNGVYLDGSSTQHPPSPPPGIGETRSSTIAPFPWRIEKDPASSGILRTSDRSAMLEYRLAGGARNSQFVAMATDIQQQDFTAIDLALSSDKPARVAVQVRAADGRRWGRSVYVDPAGSNVHIRLSDFRPIGPVGSPPPDGRDLTSVLLVIDLINALPGGAGRLAVLSSALVR